MKDVSCEVYEFLIAQSVWVWFRMVDTQFFHNKNMNIVSKGYRILFRFIYFKKQNNVFIQ